MSKLISFLSRVPCAVGICDWLLAHQKLTTDLGINRITINLYLKK